MNAYFDIRNGHIAIIETDTPEPGWIKLKSTQSRLAEVKRAQKRRRKRG